MISFNLNFVWSVKSVLLIISIELTLFIFKSTQNYTIIFFKIITRKQTSIINQSFTCQHKINKSSAKVCTHYWIVWLYSKYCLFLNFSVPLETCSTPSYRNIQFHHFYNIKQFNMYQYLLILQGLLYKPHPLLY